MALRKRLVRLHLKDNAPSLEGILRARWAGQYVLLMPKLLEDEDRSHSLDGYLEIPRENVVFCQVLR